MDNTIADGFAHTYSLVGLEWDILKTSYLLAINIHFWLHNVPWAFLNIELLWRVHLVAFECDAVTNLASLWRCYEFN